MFQEVIVGTGCNGGALCHGGMVGMLTMNDKQATYDALVDDAAMGMNLTGMPPNCADSGPDPRSSERPRNSLLVLRRSSGTQPVATPCRPALRGSKPTRSR